MTQFFKTESLVDAVRIGASNFPEVCTFAQAGKSSSVVAVTMLPTDNTTEKVAMLLWRRDGYALHPEGDWLVRTRDGDLVGMSNSAFEATYGRVK
jgi:hypothetical protein